MQTPENESSKSGEVSWSILLKKIQELALSGKDPKKCRNILRQRRIWTRLPLDRALQWARLAQAAGENDISLEVLAWLNQVQPQNKEAWKEHCTLLWALNRNQEAAQVKAQALLQKPELEQELAKLPSTPQAEDSENPPDEPFWERQKHEELLNRYMDLFQGREDCFARQWADKKAGKQGYVPVRRSLSLEDVRDHLLGRKTYGIYLLTKNSLVHVAVLDMDLDKRIMEQSKISVANKDLLHREKSYLLQRIPELSHKQGLECLTEFSGQKGYHFWYFFDPPVQASQAKKALQRIQAQLKQDISCFHLEVFPKQDQLAGKGLGNLVKLPLGVHRLSGKKSRFVSSQGKTVWEQLRLLEQIKPNTLQEQEQDRSGASQSPVVIHPRHKQWTQKFPELALFLEKCPPLAQVILACHSQKSLTVREEKVIFGTLSFLKRGKTLVHALFRHLPEYNQHLVDYKLSRVRGSPLGCRKIHTLLASPLDYCSFEPGYQYAHPLLHCPQWTAIGGSPKTEKVENLQQALEQLQISLDTVRRFLPNAPGLEGGQ